jgi:hypothetical protein
VVARSNWRRAGVARLTKGANVLNDTHRACFPLSGLTRCGCCGSGYAIIGKDRYAQAEGNLRQRPHDHPPGDRGARARWSQEQLLTPDLATEFVAAFHDKVEAIRREQRGDAALRAREASEI